MTEPRRGTVLVVDDEEPIANAIRRLLAPAHEVTVAYRIADARTLLAEHTYDAILCDLMLPDGTGMDLHAEVAARDPDLAARMVFTTGGGYTEAVYKFFAAVPNQRIDKPFTITELRATIGAVVDSR